MTMFRKTINVLYRMGLLRHYEAIDNFRYLKRLAKAHESHDGRYFNNKDKAQYSEASSVLVRFAFRGQHCLVRCSPKMHLEAGLLRDSARAMSLPEIISDHLRAGIFIDVGANVGLISIPIAKAFPQVTVVAFEPNPPAVERMKLNMQLNLLTNIELRAQGVGESEGELDLYGFDGKDIGQSSFIEPLLYDDAFYKIKVPVVRLDEVMQDADKPVEAIKIDVQGFELAVLKGAKNVVNKYRPAILLEHEDKNFSTAASAFQAKQSLKDYFADVRYDVFYVSRKDPNLLFPVRWDCTLNGDLLAIPA